MNEEIFMLLSEIKNESNPSIVAFRISNFVADALNKKSISLYEAYLVTLEELRFKRMSYKQPAWSDSVGIPECLLILNLKLLAHLFEDNQNALRLKEWGIEAFNLNVEKRKHYIMNRYLEFLDASENHLLLQELLKVRNKYNELNFDDGPYHNEKFPYDFYSPEQILLDGNTKTKYCKDNELSENIGNLIVELNLL